MTHRRPIRLLLREHGICGGTETVNLNLIKEFTEMADVVVWVVPTWRLDFFQKFLPASDRLIYKAPTWPRDSFVPHILEKATRFILRQKNVPLRFAFEKLRQELSDLWLRRLIRENDITHCFFNWIFRVDVPRVRVPIGAMIMDVRWKYFPETFPGIDVDALDRQFSDWLTKASVVFPISETTASDIKQFYPLHNGLTRVVPHGAQTNRPDGTPSPTAPIASFHRPVFYCPAGAQTHKNHITLFEACAELFAKGYDFEVVLTGFGTEHFDESCSNGEMPVVFCRAFLRERPDLFRDRIKALGYLDRSRIETLYQTCTATILPSFFEGFGLALTEAVQNGATVICSDIPAHREQLVRYGCIDKATLVPAMDATALAAEMERVLIESGRSSKTNHSSAMALERWTWKHAAAAYLESLAAVTSKN